MTSQCIEAVGCFRIDWGGARVALPQVTASDEPSPADDTDDRIKLPRVTPTAAAPGSCGVEEYGDGTNDDDSSCCC